jgi:hypothetical protein
MGKQSYISSPTTLSTSQPRKQPYQPNARPRQPRLQLTTNQHRLILLTLSADHFLGCGPVEPFLSAPQPRKQLADRVIGNFPDRYFLARDLLAPSIMRKPRLEQVV